MNKAGAIFRTSEFWIAVFNFIVSLVVIFNSNGSTLIRFTSFLFLLNFILWFYKANRKINLAK